MEKMLYLLTLKESNKKKFSPDLQRFTEKSSDCTSIEDRRFSDGTKCVFCEKIYAIFNVH